MNEAQKRRRHRAFRVAITEFFMVLTVIALVFTLTLVVMGYKISDDGRLEQDGFLQIRTSPSGATVSIDGDTLMSKTNLSKALSAGEHEVVFSKDGYDTWSKNVLITSGLTYRLNYPRMFLLERTEEKISKLKNLDFISVSPNRSIMIAALDQTKKWQIISLNEDQPTTKEINMEDVFPGVKDADFGKIRVVEWSKETNKVLAIIEWASKREWVLIDLDNVESSKNLTTDFGMQFSNIRMKNKTGEQLLVLENGNLRRLDIAAAEVSRIFINKVESFGSFGPDVIYVGRDKNGDRHIGFYREGNKEGTVIASLEDGASVKFVMSEYYGDKYVAFVVNDHIKIYRGDLSPKQEKGVLLVDEDLGFVPSEIRVRGDDELITVRNDKQYGVYDVETNKFTKYELESGEIHWINDFMFSFVDEDSNLIIEDFDKGNRRELVGNVKSGFEVSLTSDKWIYYIDSRSNLMRERIAD